MKISVVGCGYVGLVSGTCFAEMGNDVVAVDRDADRVKTLQSGGVPIYEPGLAELIQRNRSDGRLRFTTDMQRAVQDALAIFICVGTPPKPDGSTNLEAVMDAGRCVAEQMQSYKLVVVKSTVPVGTCRKLADEMAQHTDVEFDVASNPEFLKEGAAVNDFFRPDRVVAGVDCQRAEALLRRLYTPFLRTGKPFICMSTPSAEITKHACNTMLATRISFINEVAALCEASGADVEEVRRGMAADSRIGSQFLFPGLGFGGSCFPKDIRSLAHVGRACGLGDAHHAAERAANEEARSRFLERIAQHFDGDLDGRKLAFWGLAFKPRTDDVREAPALWLIKRMLRRWPALDVAAHDPVAIPGAREELPDRVAFCANEYEPLEGADALVICTEWNEFRSPQISRVKELLKSPVIFDGRNLYDPERMRAEGFTYYSVGRQTLRPR